MQLSMASPELVHKAWHRIRFIFANWAFKIGKLTSSPYCGLLSTFAGTSYAKLPSLMYGLEANLMSPWDRFGFPDVVRDMLGDTQSCIYRTSL